MAMNLVRAGFSLRVWNRTADRTRTLAAAGATLAATPAEAVRGADIVITMLADGAAVRAVMTGPDGALASGPDQARETLGPVFAALGRTTVWLGPAFALKHAIKDAELAVGAARQRH